MVDSTEHNDKHNDYGSYASLRKLVFNLLDDNSQLTPSQINGILSVSYGMKDANKQTIANYIQAWKKHNYQSALPQKPHRRVFEWFVVRGFEREKSALAPLEDRHGFWRVVSNRNGMMVFRYPYGNLHWYREGKVLVYVRGEVSWAKAKEVFCRAFQGVLSDREVSEHVDAPIHEIGRHHVFDTGQPLPRFEIRQFERSHGLRIYSDGSHPTAVEVAETEPFWLNRLDDMAGSFDKTAKSFEESMNRHLKIIDKQTELIEAFKRESEGRSEGLRENFVKVSESLDVLSRSVFALGKLVAPRPRKARVQKKPSTWQRLKRRLQR